MFTTLNTLSSDSKALSGATNMRFEQRQASAPWTRKLINIRGLDYPGCVLGFNNEGQFIPISGHWDSTYTTVNTNSASWGSGGTPFNSSALAANSASWNNTYTAVNTNSASWVNDTTIGTALSVKTTASYIADEAFVYGDCWAILGYIELPVGKWLVDGSMTGVVATSGASFASPQIIYLNCNLIPWAGNFTTGTLTPAECTLLGQQNYLTMEIPSYSNKQSIRVSFDNQIINVTSGTKKAIIYSATSLGHHFTQGDIRLYAIKLAS